MNRKTEKLITDVENYLKILGYSKSTYAETYNILIDFFEYMEHEYPELSFKKVKPEYVSNYIEHLKNRKHKRKNGGISNIHINTHILSLKKLSEYLWEGYQIVFPISHVKRLKEETKEKEILTIEEVKKLYDVTHPTQRIGYRDRAMLAVYYGCGLRRTEGEFLRVSDINVKSLQLFVRNGKGRKQRYIPLTPTVHEYLSQYINYGRHLYPKKNKREAYLFLSEKGVRIQAQSLHSRLKYLCEKAEIKKNVGLHTLRHSIATHLLQNNMELEDIALFLGHSSLESTQIYTHINESL